MAGYTTLETQSFLETYKRIYEIFNEWGHIINQPYALFAAWKKDSNAI